MGYPHDSYSETFFIERIINHPKYVSGTLSHDIAMVFLKTNIIFDDYIRPVCLPEIEANQEGSCYFTGYGRTEISQPQITTYLHEIRAFFITPRNVLTLYGDFSYDPEFIYAVAGGGNNSAPCFGDSGGPLVCWQPLTREFILQGLLSKTANNCTLPAFFVNIYAHLTWIIIQNEVSAYYQTGYLDYFKRPTPTMDNRIGTQINNVKIITELWKVYNSDPNCSRLVSFSDDKFGMIEFNPPDKNYFKASSPNSRIICQFSFAVPPRIGVMMKISESKITESAPDCKGNFLEIKKHRLTDKIIEMLENNKILVEQDLNTTSFVKGCYLGDRVIFFNQEIDVYLQNEWGLWNGDNKPKTRMTEEFFVILNISHNVVNPKVTITWDYHINDPEAINKSLCGKSVNNPYVDFRIANKTYANPHYWPWQVSYYDVTKTQQKCSGIIISEYMVIIAAHCVSPSSRITSVRIETLKMEYPNDFQPQTIEIKKVYRHPDYYFRKDCDICMVLLKKKLVFNDYVRPICLPSAKYYSTNYCFYTGLGNFVTQEDNSTQYLHEAQINILPIEVCENDYPFDPGFYKPERLFCGRDVGNNTSSVSYKNSTGVLVCWDASEKRLILHGIKYFSLANSEGITYFAKVPYHMKWILSNLKVSAYYPTGFPEYFVHSIKRRRQSTSGGAKRITLDQLWRVFESDSRCAQLIPHHDEMGGAIIYNSYLRQLFAGTPRIVCQWSLIMPPRLGINLFIKIGMLSDSPLYCYGNYFEVKVLTNNKTRLSSNHTILSNRNTTKVYNKDCHTDNTEIHFSRDGDFDLYTDWDVMNDEDDTVEMKIEKEYLVILNTSFAYYNPNLVITFKYFIGTAQAVNKSICDKPFQQQIVNQTDSNNEGKTLSRPWIVAIFVKVNNSMIYMNCSGTIIADNSVLSSISCIDLEWRLSRHPFFVLAGPVNTEMVNQTNIQTIKIKALNSNYDRGICFILLEGKFKFNDFVQQACLPVAIKYDYMQCFMTGYGRTNSFTERNNAVIIYESKFYDLSEEMCPEYLLDNTFCGWNWVDGPITCRQNSGSALICWQSDLQKYQFLGVLISANECEGLQYLANVVDFRNWILYQMEVSAYFRSGYSDYFIRPGRRT